MDELHIAGISERDTDLFLLEEFISSPEFCDWFCNAVGRGQSCRLESALRSVTSANGESDLEVIVEGANGSRFCLLIENKVNASFQPNQAARYRHRGETYVRQGKVDAFQTVLVAPRSYFDGESKGFDSRITYEEIREFVANSGLVSGRKFYKTALLSGAIEKSMSGYQTVADSAVSDFWRDYWRLILELAPALGMEEPSNKPAGAGFVYFYEAGLPRGVDLVHKLGGGFFDLQFASMGAKLTRMNEVFGPHMDSDMTIEKAAKSASIRLRVPELSTADPLAVQHDAAVQGIVAGKRLLDWARTNVTEQTLVQLRSEPAS